MLIFLSTLVSHDRRCGKRHVRLSQDKQLHPTPVSQCPLLSYFALWCGCLSLPQARFLLQWSGKMDFSVHEPLCMPIATRFWGAWLPGKRKRVLLWKPGLADHWVSLSWVGRWGLSTSVPGSRWCEMVLSLAVSIKLQSSANSFCFQLFKPLLLMTFGGEKMRLTHLGNRLEERVQVGGHCLFTCFRKVSKTFLHAQIT